MTGDGRIAVFLGALAASVFLFFAHWLPEEADTEVGFQGTRAIATRGELFLVKDGPSSTRILEKYPPDQDAYNCARDPRTGRQYPYWGLAYMAAGVPSYWIGRIGDGFAARTNAEFAKQTFTAEAIPGSEYFARAEVTSLQALFAAAAVVCVFLASRRAGASRGAALAAAMAVGFCSNLAVQARGGLSDSQATFLVAWALERALAARKGGGVPALLGLGIAIGLGLLTKLHTLFAVAALPLVLLGKGRSAKEWGRDLLVVGAAATPFAIAFLAANWARWGSPLTTGYEKSTAQDWFRIPVWLGMGALLFSPSKGVLFYALPTLLLGLGGLAVLARRDRMLAIALALSALGALAMPASTIEWHGAWAFGPRYALLAFPALAVAGARAIEACLGPLRAVPWALSLLGFALVLPGYFTSPFAAIAVSMEGARAKWPDADPSFPAHYGPADRDAERFQRLCLETGPLNFLRVQHALARAALAGRDGLSFRGDLGLERDGEALPPDQPEYRGFGSIGWVGFGKRFGASAQLWYPALMVLAAIFTAAGLRRAIRARDEVP